jgi:hypothetical protein
MSYDWHLVPASSRPEASGKEVITGPVETIVAGNLIMQMKTTGEVTDLVQGREIVARSSDLGYCAPTGGEPWERLRSMR